MRSAGKIVLSISVILACVLMVFSGCTPKRTGTAAPNQPPQVFITNTPPDSAQFSRNPDLNWYATDIDGYITNFRYAVLISDSMRINSSPVPVDQFIAQAKDSLYKWQYLKVSLDNPQSTATVRLYANIFYPVDSFITQYFFVQAQDNEGAWSQIKYRRYSRNDHYPNTHFRNNSVYINAKDSTSPLGGIDLTYSGADSTDWGRATPPLEFEWRLYGPFLDTATVFIKIVKENCIYDPNTNSFVNCNETPVLDLSSIPSTIQLPVGPDQIVSIPQPLRHSKGLNYQNDSSDVWVSDQEAKIYDVFRGLNLTKTSKFKFIFWVRTRDDGFVPDPTPSFGQFYVVEALFDKGVMILDDSYYTSQAGRWAPKNNVDNIQRSDTARNVLAKFVKNSGYGDVTGSDTTVDYFHYIEDGDIDILQILSHKVLMFFHDDAISKPNENAGFGYLPQVFFGLNMGASGLLFSRNLGGATERTADNVQLTTSANMTLYFGIQSVTCEGWSFWASPDNPGAKVPHAKGYVEEFIQAYPNSPGFPAISVDTALIRTRYASWPWWPPYTIDTSIYHRDSMHVFTALPEVGAGTRTVLAAPLYLYVSDKGPDSPFNGKVMGVRTQIGTLTNGIRSACFMFSPVATDSVATQELFNKILPWLTEKFQAAPGAAKAMAGSDGAAARDISDRNDQIQHYLKYINDYATPEEIQGMGLKMKPVQVNPRASVEIIK